jgi:hypothetical protein
VKQCRYSIRHLLCRVVPERVPRRHCSSAVMGTVSSSLTQATSLETSGWLSPPFLVLSSSPGRRFDILLASATCASCQGSSTRRGERPAGFVTSALGPPIRCLITQACSVCLAMPRLCATGIRCSPAMADCTAGANLHPLTRICNVIPALHGSPSVRETRVAGIYPRTRSTDLRGSFPDRQPSPSRRLGAVGIPCRMPCHEAFRPGGAALPIAERSALRGEFRRVVDG